MEESSAYDVARAGGRHAGLLRIYQGKRTPEIQRALRSYERQVEIHRQKMSYPEQFVQDWAYRSLRIQHALLQHWQDDLDRNRELAEVMRGILQGKRELTMQDDEKFKDYLLDLGQLVKEYALSAVETRNIQTEASAREFYNGYVLGFHRIVSLMQQQALAFGIHYKDLQLDGIEPDRDLV